MRVHVAGLLALVFFSPVLADQAAGQGTLEIVSPANPNITSGSDIDLRIVARGGDVRVENVVATVFDDTTGAMIASPFEFDVTPARSEEATPFRLKANGSLDKSHSGKGTIILMYKSGAPGGRLAASIPWPFTLVSAAPKISVNSRPKEVRRPVPFTDVVIDHSAAQYCFPFTSSSSQTSLDKDMTFDGEIYTMEETALPGVRLKGVVNGNKELCLDTTIPGPYTALKGKLWLRAPAVREPLDVDVVFRVKDSGWWRAAAALLATGLAWLFLYWGNTVRRRLINQSRRDTVVQRLAQIVAANRQLVNDAGVITIRQAILSSKKHDDMGEFDLSAQDLQTAELRLDALPVTVAAGVATGPTLVVDTDPDQLLTGKRIRFKIDNLAQTAGNSTFEWSVSKAGRKISDAGDGLQTFAFTFRTRGVFEVAVAVDGGTPLTRQISIFAPPSVVEQFKLLQIGTAAITLALAFGTTYLMTESAATFGTVGDYVKLVAGAFGVSSAVSSSVAAVFTAVRGR